MNRLAGAALLCLTALTARAYEPTPEEPAPAAQPAAEQQSATAASRGRAWPVIREIAFRGNEVTQPEVMLREMVIKVGDPAYPEWVERSRQGIQDLGLFKDVKVQETPLDDGVRLTFVVREKWYFLPVPRFDANTEGETAYGASLRWYNVGGNNHTLRGNWTRRDEEKDDRGESTSYSASYNMPFLFDSPYGVAVGAGASQTPITDFGGYEEHKTFATVVLTRSFAAGPASQGWSAGTSLTVSRQNTEGPITKPDPYGHATALGLSLGYRDVRDLIYSNEGVTFGGAAAGASESVASEYSFTAASAYYSRYTRVGSSPHQNWNVHARTGTYHGGPTEYQGSSKGEYGLGGSSVLRAYPSDAIEGDFYYHLATEYLRPVFDNWLRFAVILEVGSAFEDANEFSNEMYSSIGIGLRVRVPFLVDVEVEAGFAWPIEGGDRRFFASKV